MLWMKMTRKRGPSSVVRRTLSAFARHHHLICSHQNRDQQHGTGSSSPGRSSWSNDVKRSPPTAHSHSPPRSPRSLLLLVHLDYWRENSVASDDYHHKQRGFNLFKSACVYVGVFVALFSFSPLFHCGRRLGLETSSVLPIRVTHQYLYRFVEHNKYCNSHGYYY